MSGLVFARDIFEPPAPGASGPRFDEARRGQSLAGAEEPPGDRGALPGGKCQSTASEFWNRVSMPRIPGACAGPPRGPRE